MLETTHEVNGIWGAVKKKKKTCRQRLESAVFHPAFPATLGSKRYLSGLGILRSTQRPVPVKGSNPRTHVLANVARIQCNRRYPCNHCARRRRPEQCAYYPSQALQVANVANVPNSPVQADHTPVDGKRSGGSLEKHGDGHKNSSIFPGLNESTGPTNGHLSLANHFGYFEESKSNTMALVRRVSGYDPAYGVVQPSNLLS